jgi:hypothetical protein
VNAPLACFSFYSSLGGGLSHSFSFSADIWLSLRIPFRFPAGCLSMYIFIMYVFQEVPLDSRVYPARAFFFFNNVSIHLGIPFFFFILYRIMRFVCVCVSRAHSLDDVTAAALPSSIIKSLVLRHKDLCGPVSIVCATSPNLRISYIFHSFKYYWGGSWSNLISVNSSVSH